MKLIILLITLLFSISVYANQKSYGDTKAIKIISIYDGDTFTIQGDKNWPNILKDNISIRIDSIDCPELKDKRDSIKSIALEAKKFTSNKLKSGKIIVLKNMKRDKYFRIIASVWIDGYNLADSLKIKGLAKPYNGKSKTNLW